MDVTSEAPTISIAPPAASAAPLGARLARALGAAYELGPLIGRGGMGEVYRAFDRRLRRPVAVKVLLPHLLHAPEMRARFVREAQTAAGLSHPNVVTIYDVGSLDDLVWFVMALVDGESLRDKVHREGKQAPGVARRVLSEIGQALAYAHARGVIHRDIKPDNILIDAGSGRAMVSDFGIARLAFEGADTLTGTGALVGTPHYLSPEQALGERPIDGRSDLYALGLVGCYLLEGKDAFEDKNLLQVIAFHVAHSEIDLTDVRALGPAPLVSAIERCLCRSKDERFARMEELVEALREAGQELPEVPPAVRGLIRQSEQVLVTGSITVLGLGAVGTEKVSPAFVLLILGAVLGQWVLAIEETRRRGLGWPAVRRALEVERSRRVEEVREAMRPHAGPVGMIVLLVTLFGFLEMLRRTGWSEPTLLNRALLVVGIVGVLVTGWGFGLGRIRRQAVKGSERFVFASVVSAVVVGWQVFLRWQQPEPRPPLWRFVVAVGVSVAITLLFFLAQPPSQKREERDWHVPRWLDGIGSFVFGEDSRPRTKRMAK